jgi:hypothetical protein
LVGEVDKDEPNQAETRNEEDKEVAATLDVDEEEKRKKNHPKHDINHKQNQPKKRKAMQIPSFLLSRPVRVKRKSLNSITKTLKKRTTMIQHRGL